MSKSIGGKRKRGLKDVLKLVAEAGVFICFYPALALINGFLKNDAFLNMAELLVLLVVGFLGIFIGFLTYKIQIYHPAGHKGLIVLMTLVSAFGCFMLLYMIFNWSAFEAIALALIVGISFAVGVHLYLLSFENTVSAVGLVMVIFFFIVSNLVLWLSKAEYSPTQFATLLMVVICINGLMQNQVNIDRMMERRHYNKNSLPKKIRYFNMKLLLIPFTLLMIFYFFRYQLIWALTQVANLLIFIFLQIVRLFDYLMSLLVGGEGSGEEPEFPVQDSFEVYESNNAFWSIMFAIVFILMIIILIRYRKEIILTIGRFFSRILFDISKFFTKKITPKSENEEEAYVDTEEYIIEDDVSEVDDETKNWKKLYQSYIKMPENEEKYRFGYKLLVIGVSRKFSEITPSYTPNEICRTVGMLPMRTDLKIPTSVYNIIKYGEEDYKGSFKELDQALEVIKKTWKAQLLRSVSQISVERETIGNGAN